MNVELYGKTIEVAHPSKLAIARWSGHFSPEPETVAWIESFAPHSAFFDVGANVGTFSARAALLGHRVYSFEPCKQHYTELRRLIDRNGLLIHPANLAVSDRPGWGMMGPGRSDATFYRDREGQSEEDRVLATTLDNFVKMIGVSPDYIKIDVDGNELDVLRGGEAALLHAKSVLIEIDPALPDHGAIVPLMQENGFRFDPAQVEACRVQGGKYDGMANYIFTR